MKYCSMILLALSASAAFAQTATVVRWQTINGVITAPGVDSPVGGISAGAGPWTTTSGSARLDLTTGNLSFSVDGLVLASGNSIGTPGAVTMVTGNVVCNASSSAPQVLQTPAVPLSSDGNAHFSGLLPGIPSCTKPVFLIRVGARWIANGAVLTVGTSNDQDKQNY